MSEPSVLGIDGGGTSTTAWLADRTGTILGRGQAGPSNAKAIGADAARAALADAIDRAFADAGRAPGMVEVGCLGLAGFDRPEDRELLTRWSEASSWARRLVLVNDGDLVLAAGTPEGFGVAVIAGTGSIAVGRGPDGRTARAGGWGHLIGDEGSAYGVVLDALRLAARRADGRDALRPFRTKPKARPTSQDADRPDPLSDHLARALGVAGPEAFVSAMYAPGMDRARIAALAPAVLAAAEEDPDVVTSILDPAGYELGLAVRAVAVALNWGASTLPLAMAGGFLLGAAPVVDAMLGYLKKFTDFEVLPERVTEPAQGAVVLALRELER